jgi:hypothetical protein
MCFVPGQLITYKFNADDRMFLVIAIADVWEDALEFKVKGRKSRSKRQIGNLTAMDEDGFLFSDFSEHFKEIQ